MSKNHSNLSPVFGVPKLIPCQIPRERVLTERIFGSRVAINQATVQQSEIIQR